jgi:hypothetical protein
VIVSSNTSLDDASSSCWMIVGVSARIDMLKGEIQCSASTEPIGLRTIGRRASSPKLQLKFKTIQLLFEQAINMINISSSRTQCGRVDGGRT